MGEVKLPELPEPMGWTFQQEETGRMITLENDGVNNPTNFAKNNRRHQLVGELYTADQMRAYAEAALSTRATADAEGWQPIETAPRDQHVLISGFNYEGPLEGRWVDAAILREGRRYWNAANGPAEGFSDPTHWQLLPAPPAMRQGEG